MDSEKERPQQQQRKVCFLTVRTKKNCVFFLHNHRSSPNKRTYITRVCSTAKYRFFFAPNARKQFTIFMFVVFQLFFSFLVSQIACFNITNNTSFDCVVVSSVCFLLLFLRAVSCCCSRFTIASRNNNNKKSPFPYEKTEEKKKLTTKNETSFDVSS